MVQVQPLPPSRWRRAAPENGGPDAHHRGALGDRDLEVVAHAHGQLAECGASDSCVEQLVAQLPKPAEVRTGRFRILVPGRHQHQPAHTGGAACPRCLEQGANLGHRSAVLARLARKVHLDEQIGSGRRLGRGLIEPAQQLQAVDRVDPVEGGRRGARLVGLKMADQVPADSQPARTLDLAERLLDAVLAEVDETGVGRRLDGGQRERLRDGDEPYRGRVPVRRLGGPCQALADATQVRGDRFRSWRRTQRSALQLGDARSGVGRVLAACIQADGVPERRQRGAGLADLGQRHPQPVVGRRVARAPVGRVLELLPRIPAGCRRRGERCRDPRRRLPAGVPLRARPG